MPLGVTGWPYSPDPRTTGMGPRGFAWGAVAPYRFFLQTASADPGFEYLVEGIVVEVTGSNLDVISYGESVHGVLVSKFGTEEPTEPPDPISVTWELRLTTGPGTPILGRYQALFPPAIENFEIKTDWVGPGEDPLPDPITFTPFRWNQDA